MSTRRTTPRTWLRRQLAAAWEVFFEGGLCLQVATYVFHTDGGQAINEARPLAAEGVQFSLAVLERPRFRGSRP